MTLPEEIETWLATSRAGGCSICVAFLQNWWGSPEERDSDSLSQRAREFTTKERFETGPGQWRELREGELGLWGRPKDSQIYTALFGVPAGCGTYAFEESVCRHCGQYWVYEQDNYMGYPAFTMALNEPKMVKAENPALQGRPLPTWIFNRVSSWLRAQFTGKEAVPLSAELIGEEFAALEWTQKYLRDHPFQNLELSLFIEEALYRLQARHS